MGLFFDAVQQLGGGPARQWPMRLRPLGQRSVSYPGSSPEVPALTPSEPGPDLLPVDAWTSETEASVPALVRPSPWRLANGHLKIKALDDSVDERALRAHQRMLDVAEHPEVADPAYDALPDAEGGKVIGTDVARSLLPEYQSRKGALAFNAATSHVASSYALDRLWREIEDSPHKDRPLIFAAGGPGAGKSRALTPEVVAGAGLIYDSNFRDFTQSVLLIEHALKNGWTDLQVHHTTRRLDLVLDGVIDRAKRCGRAAPIAKVPARHRAAQKNVLKVMRRYRKEPRLTFQLFLNNGTAKDPRPLKSLRPQDIAPQGRYACSDEEVKIMSAMGIRRVKKAKLDGETRRQMLGNRDPSIKKRRRKKGL